MISAAGDVTTTTNCASAGGCGPMSMPPGRGIFFLCVDTSSRW
jgi:hypothetical protein